MAMTAKAALDRMLQMVPPGYRAWLGLEADDEIGKMWLASAAGFARYGFDVLDQLRAELRATEMVERLPVWESTLGVTLGRVARYGSLAQRRAQVIARRREGGTPTPEAISASIKAICGSFAVTILEHTRAKVTEVNWYDLGTWPALAGNADTDLVIRCADNAPASRAGAQVTVRVTHASVEDLSLKIIAPDASESPIFYFGSGAATAKDFRFAWPGAYGKTIDGDWTIRITNSNGTAGTVDNPAGDGISGLLVEGIGRGAHGADGLGARIFEWNALIDESVTTLLTYDRQAAWQAARRWNGSHMLGSIALKQTNGDTGAVCGDANCIAGMVVCGT